MLNVQEIRDIIKLVDQSSINEFTYETNGSKISMKKSTTNKETTVTENTIEAYRSPQVKKEAMNESVVDDTTDESLNQGNAVAETEKGSVDFDVEIVSPMVGTFYRKPSPESEPYVKLNSKVEESTVVCIVEAMKLFNEIEAETSGEIVEILVEDGELVEYGQPLFRVKKD